MKKILMAACLILVILPCYSQVSRNGNNFSLNTFNGNRPLLQNQSTSGMPVAGNTDTSCAFIFEYGDGYYTTSTNSTFNYDGRYANPITILSLSGRYDTIKPPPLFAKTFNVSGNASMHIPQNNLPEKTYIQLVPIASNINPNDEMTYLLTYRVPQGATCAKIVFFHNQNSFNVFDNTANAASITGYTSTTADIARMRVYFNETGTSISEATVRSSIYNGSNLAGSGYQNINAWQWSPGSPYAYEEHNIFITLRTKSNLPDGLEGYVEAALLYGSDIQKDTVDKKGKPIPNECQYTNRAVSNVFSRVSLLPHDPNFIIASPSCIKKGSGQVPVKYHVHFQNEGGGDAHTLRIKIEMDKRLKQQIRNLNPTHFKAKVGGRDVLIDSVNNITDSSFTLVLTNVDRTTAQKNDMTLRSTSVPNWFINPLTMGDIYFTMNIPVDAVTDFYGKAAIVFVSASGQEMKPVETNLETVFIRDSCTGMLLPAIKPDPKPDPCTNCNCKKLGPLCWYWWIIIAVGLLGLIWLVARRRKKEEDKVNY
jgi:hypothetical protein